MSLVEIKSFQPDNLFVINWAINNVCNYNCWYCFPGSHDGTHPSPDLDLMIKNFNHLLHEYETKMKKNKFHLMIAGGEPTLWSELSDFIQDIRKGREILVSVITNGSRTEKWWNRNIQNFDNVVVSFHYKQANIDHCINVLDIIHEQGKKAICYILMDSTVWPECVESINYMNKKSKQKWPIVLKRVSGCTYTTDQLKFLDIEFRREGLVVDTEFLKNYNIEFMTSVATDDNGNKFISTNVDYVAKNLNTFTGWECNVGIDFVSIPWSGDVEGTCKQPILGLDKNLNILDKDFVDKFKIEYKPTICQTQCCICALETHLTKKKIY